MKALYLIPIFIFSLSCADDAVQCRKSFDCPTETFCLAGTCTDADEPEFALEPETSTQSELSEPPIGPPSPEDWVFSPDLGVDAGGDVAPVPDLPAHPCLSAKEPEPGVIRITEVLSDPPPDLQGDANGDGVRNAYEDEFIELVNLTDDALKLDDVYVYVGEQFRFHFEQHCMKPRSSIVLFSSGVPNVPPEVAVLTTETRLSLSNSGASVHLLRGELVLDTFSYTGPANGSWIRWPEPDGTTIARHKDISDAYFSPGFCSHFGLFEAGCAVD